MMMNLDKIILAEESQRRKDANMDSILPANRKDFVLQWRKKHESKIYERLGTPADQHRLKFLNGIFFSPSFAKATVPHQQKVFMADACHLNFGKYTLFSCYGVTANSNASPVALQLFLETRPPAPGDSSGSMHWNCIPLLTQVTSLSSPTRTRGRKTPLIIT